MGREIILWWASMDDGVSFWRLLQYLLLGIPHPLYFFPGTDGIYKCPWSYSPVIIVFILQIQDRLPGWNGSTSKNTTAAEGLWSDQHIITLTLSLLRVINVKIPLQPHKNMTSHSMEKLTFHSLLRSKIIILQILATSLIQLLFERLGEYTFWAQEWKGWLKKRGELPY